MEKKITKSRTFWLNLIAAIFAAVITIEPLINTNLLTAIGINNETQPRVLTILGFAVAVANIYLRKKTNTPIK